MKKLYPLFVAPTPRNNETLCFVFFSPPCRKERRHRQWGILPFTKKIGVYTVWKNKKNRPG